jgi:spore coat protein U-like protein
MPTPFLRTAIFVLSVAFGCAITDSALAQSASGTINLTGTVAASCTVAVTPLPAAAALPLTTSGTQTVTVGNIVETCNTPNGYTVTLSGRSTLASSTSGASSAIAYTVGYNGSSSNSIAGSGQGFTRNGPNFSGTALPVAISFAGNANLVAATYSDTITITIASR